MPNSTRVITLVVCFSFLSLACDGEGNSMLAYLLGVFSYNTWIAIAVEISQHKLQYFGNVCCLIFTIWVARRISRHGRPIRRNDGTMDKSLQLNKLWKHVKHECTIKKKPVHINSYISVDLARDDPRMDRAGEHKNYLMMKEKTPPSMVYYQKQRKKKKRVNDAALKVFAELFPPLDVHSTMSDTLVTNTNNAAAAGLATSSRSCHANFTSRMNSMLPSNSTFFSRDDLKNTSNGIQIKDNDSKELFLWKIDLLNDNKLPDNELKQMAIKQDHDSFHRDVLMRFWGSRIRQASAMSEIAFNRHRNATRNEDPTCQLDTSAVAFVLGIMGTGTLIYRQFFR